MKKQRRDSKGQPKLLHGIPPFYFFIIPNLYFPDLTN
ncbi:hypothetical protein JOC55_004266 [Paenibacillus sacheonensis]|nr:hypothetical protein [Paenibacillus sacheonensis]